MCVGNYVGDMAMIEINCEHLRNLSYTYVICYFTLNGDLDQNYSHYKNN